MDDSHARYPISIDPFIQQGSKLSPGDATGLAAFGSSVALSSDGSTALIGGQYDNNEVGAAWVFVRSGSTWTQQGPKLTAHDETGAGLFGVSVALSSDGNTALIGGSFDDSQRGAAWVFVRSGSTWTQQGAKLTAVGTGNLGESVAVSGDGNTALIGDPNGNSEFGAAWVFVRSGSTWTQQGTKLTANDETEADHLGERVALSGDGTTALIGATGAAWVFVRSGSTWSQQGSKLTPSDESGAALFGSSGVALSGDGNTALIGGPYDNNQVGAAWVFVRSGSTWSQQGSKLTANDETGDGYFGYGGVALSSDGNTALIGGPYDNNQVGAAWVFVRSGSTWSQQGPKLTANDETGAGRFGSSVALSPDSSTALIGGIADNNFAGAAWVFANVSDQPVNTGAPTISGTPEVSQTLTCAPGTWSNSPTSYADQWQQDGSDISGATTSTYTVQSADAGHSLSCVVTATNSAGSNTAASAPLAIHRAGNGGPSPPPEPYGVAAFSADVSATILWHEAAPPGSVSGYSIREVTPGGTVGPVVATAGPTASSAIVTGVANCAGYGFEVQAFGPGGTSGWSGPSSIVVPHWTPSREPRVAVILMEGVDSTASPDVYYAGASSSRAHPSVSSYCYGRDGFVKTSFTSTLQALMDNFNPTRKIGPGVSMTDALASHDGTVILPWSFKGVWLEPRAPGGTLVHVRSSSADDADNTDVDADAATLENEVHSVHLAWPHARIVILAHSLGGLIAEQYWEYYWRVNHEGVTRIISLDGVINGVKSARGACTIPLPTVLACVLGVHVGSGVFQFWNSLWGSIEWHDQAISANDTNGAFLPVGTEGDSVYDVWDAGSDALLSQMLFNCRGFLIETCDPISPGFVSPCPSSDHSEVKACSGVIDYVEKAAFKGLSAADIAARRPAATLAGSLPGLGNLSLHVRTPVQRVIAGSPWARPRTAAIAAGQTLLLQGAELGSNTGTITFARRGGGTIAAKVTSWSASSVATRVPSGAVSGPLIVVTAGGARVPSPGIAVVGKGNGVERLLVPREITVPMGTQIRLTIRAMRGGHAAAGRTVSFFDGVRVRSARTRPSGVATFLLSPSLTGNLVVFSGTLWRTVALKFVPPPVTVITLRISPPHPRAGHRVRITATLRGSHGPTAYAPVRFVLVGARSSSTRAARARETGRAVVTFTAPVGSLIITATSYGATAILKT